MSIETLIQLWTREAIAHGYIGFLVIDITIDNTWERLDRIFLTANDNIEELKKKHSVIKEVLV